MSNENIRYWFIVLKYNTNTETGYANVGQVGDCLNKKIVIDMFLSKNPNVVKGTVLIVNFIEMTKDDYLNFFS